MSLSPMEGSKRSGMASCIVIYLKTDFVNTYTYLKQCKSCVLMYKSPMSWNFFEFLIYICDGNYVIKMFNQMSLSDTIWLPSIFYIECQHNHNVSDMDIRLNILITYRGPVLDNDLQTLSFSLPLQKGLMIRFVLA